MTPEEWQSLLDRSLLAQADEDVFKYGEYVFGHRPAFHHREMVDFINQCIADGVNGLVLEPRGFAKSTWGTSINGSHQIATHTDLRFGLFVERRPRRRLQPRYPLDPRTQRAVPAGVRGSGQ